MSRCIFCQKENDGVICKHCLTKKGNLAGGAIKKACKIALAVAPVVMMVFTRGKGK
ncbi:hypothetical protein SRRS_07700 [Sporomusa rhizae]|uniref:hypothetical protein n=1 Tax=Sporomusa rhizae TaxID=357999 RepID=UPI00352ADCED